MSVTESLDGASLGKLRENFRGQLILPGDREYDSSRIVWNAIADRHPAVIARCTRAEDVVAAVRFAREHDLVIAVRGGGHSVAGFSTCDAGIVIDLSGMRAVHVDPARRIARVQGGALLEQLDRAAQEYGLACPVGVVGHTGVGGLTLGGGMGRLERKHGYTIDNLISVDLITADGDVRHVSEEDDPELFWGLRGAGANFGIATMFEFRLHPIGPNVTTAAVVFPIERAREAAALYRDLSRSARITCTSASAWRPRRVVEGRFRANEESRPSRSAPRTSAINEMPSATSVRFGATSSPFSKRSLRPPTSPCRR